MITLQESNILVYSVYALFIVSSVVSFKKNYKRINRIAILLLLSVVLVLYGILTSLFGNTSDMFDGIKLLLILLTASAFYIEDEECIRLTINLTYIIVFVYSATVLFNPKRLDLYLEKGSNYLVLALPIGLVLSMLLARMVFQIYSKVNIKELLFEIIASVISFVTLTKFASRGSIIFPFIVAIVFALVIGRNHVFKKMGIITIVIITIYIGCQFFVQYANEYIVDRMLRLFNDRRNEDRWTIWRTYLQYISHGGRWLLGGGTGASVRDLGFYPHNLYLQAIGEFGIIGIAFCLSATIIVIKSQLKLLLRQFGSSKTNLVIIELSAGLLYLFLNFMKSFQIYDTSGLLMLAFGVISMYHQTKEGRINV